MCDSDFLSCVAQDRYEYYEESDLKSALRDLEVQEAIEVHKTVLLEGCKLTRNIFQNIYTLQ